MLEGTNIGAVITFMHKLQAVFGPDARISIAGDEIDVSGYGFLPGVACGWRVNTRGIYSLRRDVRKTINELNAMVEQVGHPQKNCT